MPSLKDFIEAMNASWPVALAILLASCALLIGEAVGLKYLQGLPPWTMGSIFIVAVFSGAVVVVRLVQLLVSALGAPFRRRRREAIYRKHLARLDELHPEEAQVLVWAALNNRQVIIADFNDIRLAPLVAKGFVDRLGGTHTMWEWPFRIPDHVWDELKRQVKEENIEMNVPNPLADRW
ncbi:super-infection exclusion protein B [Sinorhizobium meliloti]|uniref:super-infection exclusion protein B n=1 Tax=Rhizobium meliloti TaxID=382 RepID=UPI000FD6CFCE|nr:super-infection exclusion protein B [Sinorhizobium meliloti]RVL05647.1 hypothetical protein CN152_03330 [Sinorhizobium meliloti]RVN49951.1 hypothetical protein CN113_06915 [Sinorhizobium meliloti]